MLTWQKQHRSEFLNHICETELPYKNKITGTCYRLTMQLFLAMWLSVREVSGSTQFGRCHKIRYKEDIGFESI